MDSGAGRYPGFFDVSDVTGVKLGGSLALPTRVGEVELDTNRSMVSE